MAAFDYRLPWKYLIIGYIGMGLFFISLIGIVIITWELSKMTVTGAPIPDLLFSVVFLDGAVMLTGAYMAGVATEKEEQLENLHDWDEAARG